MTSGEHAMRRPWPVITQGSAAPPGHQWRHSTARPPSAERHKGTAPPPSTAARGQDVVTERLINNFSDKLHGRRHSSTAQAVRGELSTGPAGSGARNGWAVLGLRNELRGTLFGPARAAPRSVSGVTAGR